MPFKSDPHHVPEDFMSQIPLWVVVSLGKEVMLRGEFVGPCETYAKGCRGTLQSVEVYQANYGGAPYAVVALDPLDPSYLENFRFDEIEPVANRIKYSFNPQEGVIAF